MMKSIYIFCFFIFASSVTYAEDQFTEFELFTNFKNENSCWYGIEDEMTKESEKIIDFLKKFSTELNSNSPDFWKEVGDIIEGRFPSFDFSTCDREYTKSDSSNSAQTMTADIWAQDNLWFGENEEMTAYAIEVHKELILDGIDPDSDEYYTTIDEKMKNKFPAYFFQDILLENQKETSEENVTETNEEDLKETSEEDIDKFTLTIDGSDLIFEGRITSDLYDDMKELLITNPTINRVVIDSTGGLEEEALDVADLIIDFDLDTHTLNCQSSCTLMFAAGNTRTLQRGYKIGFHRSYWPASNLEKYYNYVKDDYSDVFDFTSWVYDDTQDWVFKKMQFFIERGVDPLFIIKTLRAKSEGMWYPRRKELLDANFITE